MKTRVKLFGTLPQRFPGYQHARGIELDIPDGATVTDLLALLGISETRRAVVMAEGRVLKADERIRPGVPVSVMQTISGG